MRPAVIALGLLFVSASSGQDSPSAPMDLYDGFESPSLSNLWKTSRFVPGAVQIQNVVVRAGQGAVKITLRAHDKFEAGINGKSDTERDELREATRLASKEGEVYEYSFSMFLPADFPIVPTRLVIAQWKQDCPAGANCSDDSPVLGIRYMSGALRITQDIGRDEKILYQEAREFRNRWLDFKFRVRFSTHEDGRVKAWLDDRFLVDFKGATAYAENAATGYPRPSCFYFKMGLYRDLMAEPMTIYIDEYRKKQLRPADL